ncbi:MAG: glycosyltransferase family 2 protein [Candidatus Eisenbacteria bacterium]|nr:glycosyltransferase family 2 protein [Candidatus Eisenbacteria bacterium]
MKSVPLRTSVVIPTRNRPEELKRCLASIAKQTRLPDEAIVVDSSDGAPFEQELKTDFPDPGFRLVFLRSKPGLSLQKRVGIEKATGDVIFFFDDDVVLEDGFILSLLGVFEQDERGEIAGGMGTITNLPPRRRGLRSLLRKAFFLPDFGSGKFKRSGFPTFVHDRKVRQEVECLSGGLTAYRRKVLDEIRPDEDLARGSYMEDDDLSYRISRKYKLVYEPYARLAHLPSKRERPDNREAKKTLVINHHYLFKKNFPQDSVSKLAHSISILGLILDQILAGSPRGTVGVIEGILQVICRR